MTAATDRHHQAVERPIRLDQFQRRRALAGHHRGVVERWDHGQPAALAQLPCDRLAVVSDAIDLDHLRAVPAGGLELGGGSV